MNLQQLEYIVALDKYKSFSKAAEACFITQATLSTMVKKLEEELELVLFDRKTTPILTTDCGKEILKEAQEILYHSNRLKHYSQELKGKIEGELKIGVIPTVAGNLLHRIVPALLSKYPLLKLSIQEITTENILHKLKMGELDAGILSTPLGTEEMEEEILYYEKLMVYGKVKNSKTQYLKPKDIAKENIWMLEQGNCLTDQIINVCSLTPKALNSNLHFNPNSFDSLLNLVDTLDGLTLIPELYFADLSAERKLLVKDFTSPFPVREISMVCYRPYAKLRLVNAVSKAIKELIVPILQTSKLKNAEMLIAKV
jgi:LysR family transcriptional regulator, hydrogen peroxide-inducible genes activator